MKNKNFIKIVGFFVVFSIMFGITACGSKKDDGKFSQKQIDDSLTEYFEKLPEQIIEIEFTEKLLEL